MTITRDALNLTLQEPLKMPLVPPLQETLGLFPLLVTFGGQDQKHVQTILLMTISSVVAPKALCLIQAGVTE